MCYTDGNIHRNSGSHGDFDLDSHPNRNCDSDCNGSMYAWLCGDDLDRQYGRTRHDTSGGQQL
jgi:hypothetical protein